VLNGAYQFVASGIVVAVKRRENFCHGISFLFEALSVCHAKLQQKRIIKSLSALIRLFPEKYRDADTINIT